MAWCDSTPFLFSLHELYVRMHCLPAYLSVYPIPHISTRDRALKDVSTFTVSRLSYLFYFFVSARGGEFGCFPCCAFTCMTWNHLTWKTSVDYFTKSLKKKVSSTCNTNNRFYCIYVEKTNCSRETLCKLQQQNGNLFLKPGKMWLQWTFGRTFMFLCSLSHLDLSKGSIQMPGHCYDCPFH